MSFAEGSTSKSRSFMAVRSPGLGRRLRHINKFLDLDEHRMKWVSPLKKSRPKVVAYAGWGLRGIGHREATRQDLPYVALEDGFLRSFDVGPRQTNGHSVIIDPVGIYYDATRPSLLEELIQSTETQSPELLNDASELMELMRSHNLGKFNNSPDLSPQAQLSDGRPVVFVVDQIAGDYSISFGGGTEQTFRDMLDAAIGENPHAQIIVRGHPCAGVGGRKGNLIDYAKSIGVPVFAEEVSWMSLAKRAERVYAMTSNAGLEALIAGTPVTCFGQPFYAGWGLTDDRQIIERRSAKPSLEAVVAATYLQYSRYLDPVTGRRTNGLVIAQYLAMQRRAAFGVPVGQPSGEKPQLMDSFDDTTVDQDQTAMLSA